MDWQKKACITEILGFINNEAKIIEAVYPSKRCNAIQVCVKELHKRFTGSKTLNKDFNRLLRKKHFSKEG